MAATAEAQLVMGAGPGSSPEIRVIDTDGTERTFLAYDPAFLGGVRVAFGDVNGDGVLDIITSGGPGGGPHVTVRSGTDLSYLASFFAYDPAFTGGVWVAAGDVNGDGLADIITGPGPGGGPHVTVRSGADLSYLASFFAYDPAFAGGVTVAAGDIDGDGLADIITGPGHGGSPHVLVHSGADLGYLASFFAYDPGFTGGVSVAAGDVNGDGFVDIVTGAMGPGGGPHVTVRSGAHLEYLASFFPYPQDFQGGVMVAAGDLDGDGLVDIITGPGPGGAPHVQVFSGDDLSLLASFFAFSGGAGGVSVGSFAQGGLRFTSANATTLIAGAAGTFLVTTSGFPVPALSVSGTLPTGVTFTDNADGTASLSGPPGAGTGGTYPLTFTADNGTGSPVTQNFTLTVNQAPAITSANATTFAIGAANSFTVTTTGFPVATLTQGGASLPSGVMFVDNGNGTGTLSGTPAAGTGGTYALTFTASNGVGAPMVQNFTLTVSGAPAITSANTTTFTVGSPGTFTVTTVGSPTPALSVSGTLPSGVTFTDNGDGTGTLSGTPAAGTGGVYALTFTAANGVLPNATQAFTLMVNQAPAIASANATTFTVGVAGSFTVTTSGFPAPSIVRGGVALPSGVTFVDNGNGTGTLSGTPAAGTGGTYAITFTATNTAGSSAPQAFTLTVNAPPAITSANTTTFAVGTPGTFTVTTTGSPTPALSVSGTLPAGVTFVDNGTGTGTLSGTPAAGTAGSYALTFTAANGALPNAVQSFTLNVEEAPAITSVNSTTFTVGAPGTFTVTTTGFPVPTVSQTGTLPTGVTFTPATNVLAGTATQTGAFPIVFTATNGVPPDATQNFTLNVVCPAITVTPLVMTDGLYQTLYAGVDFNQTGSTGSIFTWGATGLPAGLAINTGTGVVSGTPTNTVLNAAVVITVTDNFGCVGTLNTTLTVRPTTDNENYVGGVGHTQFAVGVAGIATPHVSVADNVKIGDNGPGTLTVTFPAASANGSVVEGTTDGTFVYTPNLNFGGPSDSFVYTLTDGNGVTNTGTVTINLSNIVWYVNAGGGAGDGRSHNPFNNLVDATTASSAGSIIYVHSSVTPTPGNLTMDDNQTLHGQGADFILSNLTIPAGTPPTLSGTVTLANNDIVRAVDFSTSGIPAMVASALTGPVTIDQVNVSGGTSALILTNVSGNVTVANASFTNTSAAEVLISQGTGVVNIAATISNNAGRSIDIQNRTGGTVIFSQPITDTGAGIFLNANTGSTINFSGALTLNTGVNPAFTATGGGSVTVIGSGNTIVTTTGTALNVANTAIGASGLTFRSISAGTGAGSSGNGLVLDSTGTAPANGGLTVTGNSAASTGGTIQHKTGADGSTTSGIGIYLNNTKNPSFSWMQLNDFDNSAIVGRSVQGFTLQESVINGVIGTSSGPVEGPINFGLSNPGGTNGLQGTGLIRNTKISGGVEHNVEFYNQSGNMVLTIEGTTAVDAGNPTDPSDDTASCVIEENSTALGSDGILVEMQDAATATITVDSCLFRDNKSQAMQLNALQDTAVTVTIRNSRATRNNGAGGQGNEGFLFSNGTDADLTATVDNNDVFGILGANIFVGQVAGNATSSSNLVGRVTNNRMTVGAVGGPYPSNRTLIAFLTSTVGQASTANLLISGNTINTQSDPVNGLAEALFVSTPDANTSPAYTARVLNNIVNINDPGGTSLRGIAVQSTQGSGAVNSNGCFVISGNDVNHAPAAPAGVNGLRLRQAGSGIARFEGSGDAATILATNNPLSTTEVLGTIIVVPVGTCLPQP
jgi:hypothetical protein